MYSKCKTEQQLVRFHLILFLFFISSNLFSQNGNIDSLLSQIKAISAKYPNNIDTPIILFKKMLENGNISELERGYIMNSIGKEYSFKKNDSATAMSYYQEGMVIAEKIGDCALQISTIQFINTVNYNLNKMSDFFNLYEKAAQLFEKCPQSKNGLYIYYQLGLNYLEKGDYDKAEKNLLKADSLTNLKIKENPYINNAIVVYNTLSNLYQLKNDNVKKEFYALKTIDVYRNKIMPQNTAIDVAEFLHIIDIWQSMNEIDSALYYAHLLLNSPKSDYVEVDKINFNILNNYLGNLYAIKGDYEKAYLYKSKYTDFLDSTVKTYRKDYFLGKIDLLDNQLKLEKKQREIDRNRWVMFFIGSLALIILVITGIVYSSTQKLKRLNSLLEAQKQELTTLNSLRTKMFSVLSHDLVSPLGGLKNMIDFYHKGLFTQEEFKNNTLDLKRHVEAILRTIQSILDWSNTQLNGKKLYIESLNIYEIIQEQCDLQTELAHQKNIELKNLVPTDFVLKADYNQISLIARNLIDNAIKYTPVGGLVEINAANTEGGKKLIFKDTGIGIKTENLQNFLNSEQKPTQKNEKIGLGLQMVYDLVKVNNCTITVESKNNEGSEFILLFKE